MPDRWKCTIFHSAPRLAITKVTRPGELMVLPSRTAVVVSRPVMTTAPSDSAGGWQFSSLFTLQSGGPFTVLSGSDPTGALAGIDALVGNAIRPNLNSSLDLGSMTVEELRAAGGAALFKPLCGNPSATCAGERVGNVPRNSLRADGIGNVDIGITKNTRFVNGQNVQIRIEMFNATNTRNFGIPDGQPPYLGGCALHVLTGQRSLKPGRQATNACALSADHCVHGRLPTNQESCTMVMRKRTD